MKDPMASVYRLGAECPYSFPHWGGRVVSLSVSKLFSSRLFLKNWKGKQSLTPKGKSRAMPKHFTLLRETEAGRERENCSGWAEPNVKTGALWSVQTSFQRPQKVHHVRKSRTKVSFSSRNWKGRSQLSQARGRRGNMGPGRKSHGPYFPPTVMLPSKLKGRDETPRFN